MSSNEMFLPIKIGQTELFKSYLLQIKQPYGVSHTSSTGRRSTSIEVDCESYTLPRQHSITSSIDIDFIKLQRIPLHPQIQEASLVSSASVL